MKLSSTNKSGGFSLSEVVIATALSTLIIGGALTSSVALQKSFNAVDNYFATHMQQVRIIDYLNRDVNRGLIVTTSVDLQSVTVTMPNYIVQSSDPEAVVNPALIGTPRTPTVALTTSGFQVNYGTTATTVVYSINGMSILRTENGVVTTIASSTDQLVPQTTDTDLANTEYTNTSVTFQPIFTTGGSVAGRTGTNICATSYLRNKRRG